MKEVEKLRKKFMDVNKKKRKMPFKIVILEKLVYCRMILQEEKVESQRP